ncbi:Str2p [Sugiyamaella lignohabitans]|uniref:cystathionine gamma-synthase n=1 Tax=Sugiyamaella lignohabitans TaxID=796027 RepID=A0A167E5I7_9ASCO|nr:Str2p [Sugiyamaella lignohabitans]ANB13665.1 Str2p [Sugiyamaella lignohabitans]
MPSIDSPPTAVGCPIPSNTPHAVSVTLPSWAANVAYEEGENWVASKMSSGYPRFFVHHRIQALSDEIESSYGREGEKSLIFPSYATACRCRDFIKRYSTLQPCPVRIVQLSTPKPSEGQDDGSSIQAHIAVVFFPQSEYSVARKYWQHTGEGVSSRLGEYFLEHWGDNNPHNGGGNGANTSSGKGSYKDFHRRSSQSPVLEGLSENSNSNADSNKEQSTFVEERFGRNLDLSFAPAAKLALRRRIAGKITESGTSASRHGNFEELSEDDVYLYATGMTSIYSAHRAVLEALGDGKKKSVCFGFPYTDTLKILEKWGPGVHFYGNGEQPDLAALEKLLEDGEQIVALFCEFPSNPLLKSPDLVNIRRLADKYNFAVVVDETVGNFVNIHVLPYSDIVVSSLTKVFSGESNVMGGSLVLNPRGKHFKALKDTLGRQYEDNFWAEDAIYLERNSRDFAKRNEKININTEAVTELLRQSPIIKDLFYPKYVSTKEYYDTCRVDGGGYGGLFSIVFHNPQHAKNFFDRMVMAKGPSLGTNFTLSCPYTIIAHYLELDFVEKFGVDRHLVRISVGLEETEELLERFRKGLEACVE